jgi:UDP-N-acetyl-D-mannosaminuronic acid dehydrogenase
MFTLLSRGLERAGKTVKDSKIALLGWSFIPNTDDTRNSPAIRLRELCLQSGAVVDVHDPWVREYPGVKVSGNAEEVLSGADAVVIVTGHKEYSSLDPAGLVSVMAANPVVVDGRNLIDPDIFIGSGFIYKGIGRGDKNRHPWVPGKEQAGMI